MLECAPFGEVQDAELEFGGRTGAVVLRDRCRVVALFPKLRFRGGLVFKAHRLVYHSTLGISAQWSPGRSFVSKTAVQTFRASQKCAAVPRRARI